MITIILPIKKCYSDLIFSGEKRFEFRRKIPTEPVNTILVYESQGCGKIVGRLTIGETLTKSVKELYQVTKEYGGVDFKTFCKYFEGCQKCNAYSILSFDRFNTPKDLSEYGLSKAPQNFVIVAD